MNSLVTPVIAAIMNDVYTGSISLILRLGSSSCYLRSLGEFALALQALNYGSERYGIFCGISQWEGMGLEYGMGLEDLSSHIFL